MKLLVSLHDVSPLTLAESRAALALVTSAGVPTSALTALVVPFHDERIALADDRPTLAFVRGLADNGATIVAHGYTHRMVGRPRTPWRWLWTRLFARNQGELAVCDRAETARRLDDAAAAFARAAIATYGFVPPAWLLSRDAAAEVAARGFAFVEHMRGILASDQLHARRLIGWGSLTTVESIATSAWAWIQTRRAPADTRVAIHPADLVRARSRRSLARTLARLVAKLEPISYRDYLAPVSASPRTSARDSARALPDPVRASTA